MIRTRFAPSPTGLLHVGNVRTGRFAWLFARQAGGAYIIRIEDTDQERSEQKYEDLIYEDLRWLGLDWDEAPDIGGSFGPYRQSERNQIYKEVATRFIQEGSAYWCFCSEEELEQRAESARAAGESWKYPGTCRSLGAEVVKSRLAKKDPAVVRLRVREGAIHFHDIVHGAMEFESEIISDPILLRSDGWPTYNYAVVVDDALMKITHVIRGDDHLSNTPKQVLIYEALKTPLPEFAHLSTILGPDHARLSKRHGATAVAQFREAGYLPEALMNYIALLGWSPASDGSEVIPKSELVSQFRLDRVNKSPAVFDTQKLDFINRHYMKTSPLAPILVAAELEKSGWMPQSEQDAWLAMVMDTVVPSVDKSSDVPGALTRFLDFPIDNASDIQDTLQDPGAMELLRQFSAELQTRTLLTTSEFRAIAGSLKDATKRKGKLLFHPMRASLTMKSSGPELDKLIPMIEAAARLNIQNVNSCSNRASAFLERYG
jgi:glutamyl-tRNA synthetase/nondiscriminating glutamyl-tRNA synthetase